MNAHRSATLVVALLPSLPTACSPTRDSSVADRIDAIVRTAIDDGHVAGASVAVYRDGRPMHVAAYGWADMERRIAAEPSTPFNIGSVTKMFTAAAAMKLVEAGTLSLDDALIAWAPEFPNDLQARRITLRQLISHTAGLNEYGSADLARWERSREPLTRDFVLSYLDERDLDFEPGSHWAYSNTGFFLAGVVIEAASGMPWFDYLKSAILDPLGLDEVRLCDDVEATRARGYELDDGALKPASLYIEAGVRGDGGLCATARDIARFAVALDANAVLADASGEAMRAPTRLTSGIGVDYGLGVRRGMIQGHPLWGHTGGHAGSSRSSRTTRPMP
jgi:CubicO group peptidase (beta-lactamase class C family)